MKRKTFIFAAILLSTTAAATGGIVHIAHEKAYPETLHHATPTMQAQFPELF